MHEECCHVRVRMLRNRCAGKRECRQACAATAAAADQSALQVAETGGAFVRESPVAGGQWRLTHPRAQQSGETHIDESLPEAGWRLAPTIPNPAQAHAV